MKILWIAFFISLSINAADTQKWYINKDHSQIMFDIPYLGISKVIGRFNGFQGAITLNETKKDIKKIDLFIETQSIYTGNNLRDGHLKNKDFLDSKKYPLIYYNSINIKKIDNNRYEIIGDLKIKNIIKKHKVFLTILGNQKDSWSKDNLLLSFKTELNRNKYQIKWNKNIDNGKLLLGETINVFGNLQLQLAGDKTQSSKYLIPITRYTKLRNKLNIGEISKEEFKEETKTLNEVTPKTKELSKDSDYEVTKEKITTNESISQSPIATTIPQRTPLWWLSFVTMGFFSFIGGVLGIIAIKKMFFQKYQEKYDEVGLWGYVSDIYILAFLFIYAWAQWYLGWGA